MVGNMTVINDTKTEILDVALDLIQRQSLSGVSFQALADLIGIKKGSMYYHFPSKDDLAIAVITRAGDELKAAFESGLHKSPLDRLRYFFKIYKTHIGAGKSICPGAAFVGEWDQLSPSVQDGVTRLLTIQANGVEAIIKDGIDENTFVTHGNSAKQLALWVVSSIQGALLTSRGMKDAAVFNLTTQAIENTLTASS